MRPERETPDETAADLVQWLEQPEHYPERPSGVDLRETHISWVFLTDRFAWKLKKPVRFEFLDFSTREARRRACEEEVRLNRRLAEDVYLGTVPVYQNARGGWTWHERGEPADWLVKMRRLFEDVRLDLRIRRDTLTEADVKRVAERLTDFYLDAGPLTIHTDQYRRNFEQHVRANREELLGSEHELSPARVKRVHTAQLRVLMTAKELLDARVCDGRIIEGHGDLRPEHIYLEEKPTVIDCIEFNREFRVLDVVDELCFLAMECDGLGAEWVGRQVLDAYCDRSGDDPPETLIAFYKSYRACVRAKVAALRSEQDVGSVHESSLAEAAHYLELADGYAARIGPPQLVIVSGTSGTGKSTLAAALSAELAMDTLSTDQIRRSLVHDDGGAAGFGEGRYRPEMRRTVYAEMFRRGDALLGEGQSVVLDGTFLERATLDEAIAVARRHGARPLVVRCTCPDRVALERVAERQGRGDSASEMRPELLEEQRKLQGPLPEGLPSLEVDTTYSQPEQVGSVLAAMSIDGAA